MTVVQNGDLAVFGPPIPQLFGDGLGVKMRRTTDGVTTTIVSTGVANAVKMAGSDFFGIDADGFTVSAAGVITYTGAADRDTVVHAMTHIQVSSGASTQDSGLLLALNGTPIEDSAQQAATTNSWGDQVVAIWRLPALATNDTIELYVAAMTGTARDIDTSQVLAVVV